MAIEKLNDLSGLSESDLKTELDGLVSKYQKLQFEHAVKGLENPLNLREVRRNIARVNTELRQREIAAMSDAELARRSTIRKRRSK